jgi:hypothetical protein
MARLFLGLATLLSLVALTAATAGASSASAGVASVPVTGTSAAGDTFTGTIDVTGFTVQNGSVVALGTLSGTLRDAAGNTIANVSDVAVAAPVQAQQATPCTILKFSLGGLDFAVDGIALHVDPIGLSVELSGLLGNILCPLLGIPASAPPPA